MPTMGRSTKVLLAGFIAALSVAALASKSLIFSAAASHIVISEVQIAGTTASDEFVELYNPTDTDVVMTGWRLSRLTSGGSSANLVTTLDGTIPAHGYFLIADDDYDGSVIRDAGYSTSSSMASGATVYLFSDAGVTLVDKVGMGASVDPETAATIDPAADASVERKAGMGSTSESMGTGGDDELLGNGEDTDDNSMDFVSREVSDPQNSSSFTETPPSPTTFPTMTPTPTVEPTITPSDEPTMTPTPTEDPTATPMPTEEPTSTPTMQPTMTPTPTFTPTATPTNEPTATHTPTAEPTATSTPTMSPTTTPTPTMTPTPSVKRQMIGIFRFPFATKSLVCYQEYTKLFFSWSFPTIKCVRV